MTVKVAINGFGRIGRMTFRALIESGREDVEVVAINDLASPESSLHLLKYDTVHGRLPVEAKLEGDMLIAGSQKAKMFAIRDPKEYPWKDLDIDVVFECTGIFTEREKAQVHLDAAAKRVLVSAPAKGADLTVVYGVNENILDGSEQIVSASSCTTNCLAPVINILENNIGIEEGFMSTIHAYTNDQVTLDISHKKGITSRRGRACALNIIPTSTGATSSVEKVIPSLQGKLDGNSYRVPIEDGSLVEFTFIPKRETSVDEINGIFERNQSEVIKITYDPIVSSDIIGKNVLSNNKSKAPSIADAVDELRKKKLSILDQFKLDLEEIKPEEENKETKEDQEEAKPVKNPDEDFINPDDKNID